MSSSQLDCPPYLAHPQPLHPWLKRLTTLANSSHRNLVLVGVAEWGIQRLLQSLAPAQTTLWVALDARHLGDPQAQASTLLEALEQRWGTLQLERAQCLSCVLRQLKHQLKVHQSQAVVLSGAEFAPNLAARLLEMSEHQRVLVWFRQAPKNPILPKPLAWITPDELRLTFQEALNLAAPGISALTAQTFHQLSHGALENFLALCHQHLKLPPLLAPSTAFPGVVEELLQRPDLMGALELVVRDYPHLTPLLLQRIERMLHLHPEHPRLYRLLQTLPANLKQHQVVLRWRLEAALELGLQNGVLGDAVVGLQDQATPELRAVYAEALYRSNDLAGYLRQAEQAAQHSVAPQVLFTYGKALDLSDPQKGRPVLLQALQQAEQSQDWFWAVQAALALSQRYTTLGLYPQATRWAEWGLRTADHHNVQARHSRLWLLNEWAYARMMGGETLGLVAQLQQVLDLPSDKLVNPDGSLGHPDNRLGYPDNRLDYYLRTTLGDVLLAEGRPQEALEVYWPLWQQRQVAWIGALSNLVVRALLELGRFSQAMEVATEGVALSQDLHKVQRRRATLALGMVLALSDPAKAISILRSSLADLQKPLLAHRVSQAGLYLAHAQLQLGQTGMALSTFKTVEPTLEHLGSSGLRYLSGDPAVFRSVLALWQSKTLPRLELRFLGEPEVRLDGVALRLGSRACEVLAALVLHPQGLTAEALSMAIYGSPQESETIPVLLSGLKQRNIPIHSRPYRLGIEVWADFLELPNLLRQNRLREALSLIRGAILLPKSESPIIRIQREHLCKMLQEAVLQSKDLEALLALAERKPGDLELWNQVMDLMPQHDPRRSRVQVQQDQVGIQRMLN